MQYNQADVRIVLGDTLLMDKGQPLPFDKAAASGYLKGKADVHGTVNIQVGLPSDLCLLPAALFSFSGAAGTAKLELSARAGGPPWPVPPLCKGSADGPFRHAGLHWTRTWQRHGVGLRPVVRLR